MDENKNVVPFEVIPQIHTGSFLTKEQAEQFKEAFKDLTAVVRCKDCKWGDAVKNAKGEPMVECLGEELLKEPDWYCADGERR